MCVCVCDFKNYFLYSVSLFTGSLTTSSYIVISLVDIQFFLNVSLFTAFCLHFPGF